MKFKSNIEVQAGIEDKDGQVGSNGQILASTGSQVDWIDQGTISAESAEVVEVPVKNVHTATILKGTPVYISGSVGSSGRLEVKPADASVAGSMPALGLLKQDLAVNAEGLCVITGKLRNLITSPIDGVTTNDGDVVYVKAGGGLTTTKPTGSANLIQNMGKVGVSSTSNNGTFVVSSILRSNDVPNLTTGKIWVGDGNTIESSVVFLDEPNGRMGIGTTSPADKLEVYNNGGDVAIRIHEDAGTHEARLHLRRGGSDWELISNNNFTIESEGSEKFRITPTGNVGIGTTSPENKLHVQQSALYTGIQTTAGIRVKSDGGSAIGNYHGTIALSRGTGSVAISAVQEAADSDVMGMAFFTHPSSTGGDAAVEQMRIDQNGNIGIGTTNPLRKLHVVGNFAVNAGTGEYYGVNITGGEGADPNILIGDWHNSSANIKWDSLGNYLRIDAQHATSGAPIVFSGNDSAIEYMRIDSSGNVGIGTTSPDYLLDVEGSVNNADIGIRINNTFDDNDPASEPNSVLFLNAASNNGYLRVHGAPANTAAKHQIDLGSTAASSFLTFSPGGAERMRIATNGAIQFNDYGAGTLVTDSSGNITVSSGGGAGGPYLPLAAGSSYPLTDTLFGTNTSMSGNGTYAGSMNLGNGGGTGEKHLTIGNGSTGNGYRYIDLVGDTTYTDYGLRIIRGNSGANTSSQIVHRGTGDFSLQTTEAGKMRFVTANSERMRITSTGDIGIGTSSPGAKLEVNGNVAINSTGLTEGFQWFNDTNEIFSLEDTSGAGELLLLSSNSVKVKLNANGSSYLNGGNVGIGTTNPVEKLHIENTSGANIILNSNTSAANNGIYMSEGSSSTPTQNGAYFYYDSSANAVKLDTGTSSLSTKLTVSRDSGNVGIGTTSPAKTLHVFSGTDNEGIFMQGTGGGHWFNFQSGTSNLWSMGAQTGMMGWYNRTTGNVGYKMVIQDGGNVGIGTTSPNGKLEVLGVNNDAILTLSRGNASQYLTFRGYQMASNGNHMLVSADDAKQIWLGHQSTTAELVIDVGGNVGIGTTSPTNTDYGSVIPKLHVLQSSTSGAFNLASRFQSGGDANDTGASILINHSNDRGLLIEGGRGGAGTLNDDDAVSHLGLVTSSGALTRMITLRQRSTVGALYNVGIGTQTPESKLQVAGGIQIADDTATASAAKVGTLKYRVSGNNSYVDMCMQTGATTYAWINIVQNNW